MTARQVAAILRAGPGGFGEIEMRAPLLCLALLTAGCIAHGRTSRDQFENPPCSRHEPQPVLAATAPVGTTTIARAEVQPHATISVEFKDTPLREAMDIMRAR